MDYAQKLEIMAAAITAETAMNMDANLEKGVLDGLRRIEEMEKKEKEALDPLVSFCVEHIQEGYGIWNSGGYDEKKRYGTSTVAAGPEGERLRLVHYEKKVNGNHSLAVIYPGCYIAQSVAFDYLNRLIRSCIRWYRSVRETARIRQTVGRCCGSTRVCQDSQRKRKSA